MKNRVKEATNYEMEIRNNPFKLPKEIKTKMFGQVRAKYKYNQVTNTLLQFFGTKQEHGESLTECNKRFKQARDNVKSTLGIEFLHGFIKNTDKCNNVCEDKEQGTVLAKLWDGWTSFMQLRQSNKNKYGLFLNFLDGQHPLGIDEFPTNNIRMTDAMTRHTWDNNTLAWTRRSGINHRVPKKVTRTTKLQLRTKVRLAS